MFNEDGLIGIHLGTIWEEEMDNKKRRCAAFESCASNIQGPFLCLCGEKSRSYLDPEQQEEDNPDFGFQ